MDDLPEALRRAGRPAARAAACRSTRRVRRRRRCSAVAGRARPARPYDVVLIDWRMAPHGRHRDAAAQLRALLGAGMPPALLVTAYDDAALCAAGARRPASTPCWSSRSPRRRCTTRCCRCCARQHAPPRGRATGRRRRGASCARATPAQRVLLAEDNPINQEVAMELLRAVGLRGRDRPTTAAQAVEHGAGATPTT